MFQGIKVNKNWKKRYNKELMQTFGDLDTVSLLNWIGHVNRMGGARMVRQVCNNNPQGSRLRGRPKNGRWNCVQIDINTSRCKSKNWEQ